MDFGSLDKDFLDTFLAINTAGVQFVRVAALFGLGFNFSRAFFRLINSNIRIGVAISDFIRDSILVCFIGYAIGAVGAGEIIYSSLVSTADSILKTLNNMAAFHSLMSKISEIISAAYATGDIFLPIIINALPLLIFGLLIGGFFSLLID